MLIFQVIVIYISMNSSCLYLEKRYRKISVKVIYISNPHSLQWRTTLWSTSLLSHPSCGQSVQSLIFALPEWWPFPLQSGQHYPCIRSFCRFHHFSFVCHETVRLSGFRAPAINKVVSISVDFICLNAFWIMTHSFKVPLTVAMRTSLSL